MQQYTTILTEDKFTPSELRVHKGIPVVITNNTNRYCYLDCCEEHLAPGDKANVIFFESTEVTDLQNIFLLLRVTVEAQEPPSTPTPNNTLVLSNSQTIILDAFIYACSKNQIEVVEKRLAQWSTQSIQQRQLYLNHVSDENETALHAASKHNNVEIVKLLLQHGADCESIVATPESNKSLSALHLASKWGRHEIVRTLIDHNPSININAKDSDTGQTALHLATAYGHLSVIIILLTSFCDPTKANIPLLDPFVRDANNKTALSVAMNGGIAKQHIQEHIYRYQTSTYKKHIKTFVEGLALQHNFGLGKHMTDVPMDCVGVINEFIFTQDQACELFSKLQQRQAEEAKNFFKKKVKRTQYPIGMNI